MSAQATSGRVLRIKLGGRPEKRDLLRRIHDESGSDTLMVIDSAGVLTAFVEDDEAGLDLAGSVFASCMYPLSTLEQVVPAEGIRHAS